MAPRIRRTYSGPQLKYGTPRQIAGASAHAPTKSYGIARTSLPADFCFCAWRVLLGDHDFDPAASFEADLRAADADVVANRRVRHLNGVVFLDEADVDPAGGVPLLPRRLKVGAEHVVDGRLERIQPGRGTHRPPRRRRRRPSSCGGQSKGDRTGRTFLLPVSGARLTVLREPQARDGEA